MQTHEEHNLFIEGMKCLYTSDPLFKRVLSHPDKHRLFSFKNGLIFTPNCGGEQVLYILQGYFPNGKSLYGIIAEHAHKVLGHFGGQRTPDYVPQWYCCLQVNSHIEEFCKPAMSVSRQKP